MVLALSPTIAPHPRAPAPRTTHVGGAILMGYVMLQAAHVGGYDRQRAL